ncbi:hypothetical protein [Halorientalis sp.]|jgi:hypothetical protein|uniref:hypothetical protein n=1 Tax=Halorientalis sp. TaxID=1931229 RepID=UPI0026029FA3|nr:hypothetical protein [Halorientalis sp.]
MSLVSVRTASRGFVGTLAVAGVYTRRPPTSSSVAGIDGLTVWFVGATDVAVARVWRE